MQEVLDTIYFDNTIKQYILVAGIILIIFIFKKWVAHYAAGLIYALFKRRWKNISKTTFRNLVTKPLGLFVAVLVAVAALDQLHFPHILNFSIYHIAFHDILRIIGTGLIIITFFRFIIKCTDFIGIAIKDKYLQDGNPADHQLFFFFKDFIKVIIALIAIMFILKYCFSYDIKGLVTGLSIVGAAIALALKESLENLIASFIIFFDKPFATGDVVKVNNISGTIEKIGLRSTRIRSDAKTYITVPNKQMVDSILDNQSNRIQRRGDLKLELSPSTAPEKIKDLVNGMNDVFNIQEINNYNIYVNDINANAIVVNVEYYTAPNDVKLFQNTKQKVNLEVLELMKNLSVELTGKVTDIKIIEPSST